MEITGVITKIIGLRERPYNDTQGNPQVFASFGVVISNGLDTIAAEAVGVYARSLSVAGMTVGLAVTASVGCEVRFWTDNNQQERCENVFTLRKIAPTVGKLN